MSDYGCSDTFSPKRNCPITSLYWRFLAEHESKLADNPLLAMPLRSLRRRSEPQRAEDRRVAEWARETVARGAVLEPLPTPPGQPGSDRDKI